MQNLLDEIKQKKEQLDTLRASLIDGNGRTARLLMNLVFLRNDYPQVITKVSNRVEYIQAIEKYQQSSSEYNNFYKVVLQSVNDSLDLYSTLLANDIKVI